MPNITDPLAVRPLHLWLLRDIPNVHIKFGLKLNHNFQLLSTTINSCSFERQIRENVFLRMWAEDTLKYLKFKVQCPFKQGYYEIGEHQVAGEGFGNLPAFIHVGDTIDFFYSFNIKLKGQMLEFFSCNGTWTYLLAD